MNHSTHIRYHHGLRPTRIEVRCPRCRGCALAIEGPRDLPAADRPALAMLPFRPGGFHVTCTACMHRAECVAYEDLGECYHEVEAAGVHLWAWNAEHLATLRDHLAGVSVAGRTYADLMTYVPGDWMKRREKLVRAIDEYAYAPRKP